VNPDALTAQALLNCLVREVSVPEAQAWEADGYVTVRLARSDRLLRLTTRRPSAGLGPRLTGHAALYGGQGWDAVGWEKLARLIGDELTLATGTANDEFATQVRSSHTAIAAIVAAGNASGGAQPPATSPVIDRYLASEQSLVAGHRFHPAPKARGADPREWLPFAPEAGARFPLRFLAVRADVLRCDGDTTGLDRLGSPPAPPGYAVLPAHPWQLRLLDRQPWLASALRDGLLIDLGPGSREVAATSSVRTVYDPAADIFCKFSLNVRITNCVRKNSWYELAGAVALTRLLGPVFTDLAARFPGTAMLGEPGYRTASLAAGERASGEAAAERASERAAGERATQERANEEAVEGLSVIVREGVACHLAPAVTPVLAAALAEPAGGRPGETAGGLLDGRDPEWLVGWWEAYVRAVAPPVLHALAGHGVVLEPHLQNVLVGMNYDGMPVQANFRDMEGTKLLVPRHDATLATLEPGIARALGYDAERAWNRVTYCLIVNHLAEIAAAIADRHPGPQDRFEAGLWHRAGRLLMSLADDHGWPPPLRAVLAGAPLPAKANLRLRWMRGPDREAGYLTVPSPLGDHLMARRTVASPC
jgi:siderophore synthetase component